MGGGPGALVPPLSLTSVLLLPPSSSEEITMLSRCADLGRFRRWRLLSLLLLLLLLSVLGLQLRLRLS